MLDYNLNAWDNRIVVGMVARSVTVLMRFAARGRFVAAPGGRGHRVQATSTISRTFNDVQCAGCRPKR
jgi:hypothetical protein